jgi:sortase A
VPIRVEVGRLSRRTARLLLATVVALAVIAAVVAGVALLDGARSGAAKRDNPVLHNSQRKAPVPSSTTPPTQALPQPEDSPKDPNADVPITQIGEIEIPKIGLVHPVFEGVWLTVINHGPGHWPGSAEPGGYGNTVFAGHRVTHTHPFRRINELVAGDDIIVRTDKGVFTYKVTSSEVVMPKTGISIVDQHPGHVITLFACHPPGSAQYRYVVHGDLVSSQPPA